MLNGPDISKQIVRSCSNINSDTCSYKLASKFVSNSSSRVGSLRVKRRNYFYKVKQIIQMVITAIRSCVNKYLPIYKETKRKGSLISTANKYSSSLAVHNICKLFPRHVEYECIAVGQYRAIVATWKMEHNDTDSKLSEKQSCVYVLSIGSAPDSGTNKEGSGAASKLAIVPSMESGLSASNASSSTSIKTRKSNSILAQLMSRTRRKKRGDSSDTKLQLLEARRSIAESNCNDYRQLSCASLPATISESVEKVDIKDSKSKIPVLKRRNTFPRQTDIDEKVEESTDKKVAENLVPKEAVEENKEQTNVVSNQVQETEIKSPKSSKNQSFFRKLLTKQTNRLNGETKGGPHATRNRSSISANTDGTIDSLEEEISLADVMIGADSSIQVEPEMLNKCSITTENKSLGSVCSGNQEEAIPLKYIKPSHPKLDISLMDALQESGTMLIKLKEDEEHVAKLLVKYVKDTTFQRDLLDAVYHHSKLQLETERRVQALANDLWLQQAEISRSQEQSLQETLNSIIKQNRKLQEDNGDLLRKNEQLQTKLTSLAYLSPRGVYGGNALLDNLSRSNEQLQFKVNTLLRQIEGLENELQNVQKYNRVLEERVRNSNAQIQHHKAMLQRINADRELEVATLNRELQTHQLIIKDSVDAGDVLLEDLDALKRQAKSMPCTLNWAKFKYRGSSLTDLIHLGRSCINELTRELMQAQSQISLKDKEINNLEDGKKALQENLQKCNVELDKAVKEFETYKKLEQEICIYQKTNKELQDEISGLKLTLQKSNEIISEKDASLVSLHEGVESIKHELEAKDVQIQGLQKLLAESNLESSSLKTQISGMNEVLGSTGAGDMAKHLVETQERMSFFEEHYYQLLYEKNFLAEQIKGFNAEKETLLQYQHAYYEHLQSQLKDLETLGKENAALKEQLEEQRANVLALQAERMRHLEEKTVLKEIYQQLREEISKYQKLEFTVADMNKEATRLAVVAEYNKQLGEKLKSEVEIREEAISQLQKNVEVLNTAQMENTKDKMALCMELSEACALKDQLSNSLSVEVQRNSDLGQSQKDLESATNVKLKELEEMQKLERIAMKSLLDEYQLIVNERNQLLSKQKELEGEVMELRGYCAAQTNSYNQIAVRYEENEAKTKSLEHELEQKKMDAEDLLEKVAQKDRTVEELQKANGNLEESLKYLQNNVQRLNQDLNNSWKTEMENKHTLEKLTGENQNLKQTLETQSFSLELVEKENEELHQEMIALRGMCKKLVNECEARIEVAMNTEDNARRNFQDSQGVVEKRKEEIDHLLEVVNAKEREIQDLTERCEIQNAKITALEDTLEEAREHANLLASSAKMKDTLAEELSALHEEYNTRSAQLVAVVDELESTRARLSEMEEERRQDMTAYNNKIEELIEQYNIEKRKREEDTAKFEAKCEELAVALQKEKGDCASLTAAHKELASKLLKAIRLLIDEKIAHQSAMTERENLRREILELKMEKEQLDLKIEACDNEVEDLRKLSEQAVLDKTSILRSLNEAQSMQKGLHRSNELLEQKIKEYKRRYKDALHRIRHDENGQCDAGVSAENTSIDETTAALKSELSKAHATISELKQELLKLKQEITALEFKKCEMSLRLYDTQGQLNTEHQLNIAFRNAQQRFLTSILQMRNDGLLSDANYNTLLSLVAIPDHDVTS